MRRLAIALDIAGAGLLASGLCLLAWLAHPYLVPVTAGVLCLAAAWLVERSRSEP